MADVYWATSYRPAGGERTYAYYYGERRNPDASERITKAQFENRHDYTLYGGSDDLNFDGIPDLYDDAYYAAQEQELTTLDQIERVVYSTGLWTEGIVKGAFLVLPIILMVSITIGLTMGIIRVGVRGTERRLLVRKGE